MQNFASCELPAEKEGADAKRLWRYICLETDVYKLQCLCVPQVAGMGMGSCTGTVQAPRLSGCNLTDILSYFVIA